MLLKGNIARKEEQDNSIVKQRPNAKKEVPWVRVKASFKKLQDNDIYVLGEADVSMPPVVSSSTLANVKARLVCLKEKVKNKLPKPGQEPIKVLQEWEFTNENQTIPIYLDDKLRVDTDLWVEMLNPNDEDAVVNATIYGVFRSRRR